MEIHGMPETFWVVTEAVAGLRTGRHLLRLHIRGG